MCHCACEKCSLMNVYNLGYPVMLIHKILRRMNSYVEQHFEAFLISVQSCTQVNNLQFVNFLNQFRLKSSFIFSKLSEPFLAKKTLILSNSVFQKTS